MDSKEPREPETVYKQMNTRFDLVLKTRCKIWKTNFQITTIIDSSANIDGKGTGVWTREVTLLLYNISAYIIQG